MADTEDLLEIGDKVVKVSGYRYTGEIRSIIKKKDGSIRYVVESTSEDTEGMLHIFSRSQIALVERTVRPPRHSPGPWGLRRSKNGTRMLVDSCVDAYNLRWEEFASVVVRMDGVSEDNREGLANARLIAAAPDMLKALKAIYEASEDGEIDDIAISAIYKAEGQNK